MQTTGLCSSKVVSAQALPCVANMVVADIVRDVQDAVAHNLRHKSAALAGNGELQITLSQAPSSQIQLSFMHWSSTLRNGRHDRVNAHVSARIT